MTREKQDDWKRTQVRMPQDQYDSLMTYAEKNNLSLNTAMLELMDRGLTSSNSRIEPKDLDVKILKLTNGKKRIIYGKLIKAFDLDYTQDLTSLKSDIELSLKGLKDSSLLKRLSFFNKNVRVHQGSNHLDIIDDGVGSLNWLVVEDHIV